MLCYLNHASYKKKKKTGNQCYLNNHKNVAFLCNGKIIQHGKNKKVHFVVRMFHPLLNPSEYFSVARIVPIMYTETQPTN